MKQTFREFPCISQQIQIALFLPYCIDLTHVYHGHPALPSQLHPGDLELALLVRALTEKNSKYIIQSGQNKMLFIDLSKAFDSLNKHIEELFNRLMNRMKWNQYIQSIL